MNTKLIVVVSPPPAIYYIVSITYDRTSAYIVEFGNEV